MASQLASTSESLRERQNRAAIFVDAEYFRISCLGRTDILSSSTKLIEFIKSSVPELSEVDRWRCFAYDARYAGKAELSVHPAERSARKRLHRMLIDGGFTVRFGSYVLRDIRVVGDVKSTRVMVQKGVDTMIVVDAMREAFTVGTETLIFITGDSDFVPLFSELRVRKKRTVLLYGDPDNASGRLVTIASAAVQINRTSGHQSVQQRLA